MDGRAQRELDDPDKYLMISADCHANEPGSLWRDRIDEKYRDRLPHVEVDANGEKWFIAEGTGKSRVRARMIGDVPREGSEDRMRGHVGADPKERIQDQLRDGIDAEIIFPNKGLDDVRDQGCGIRRSRSAGSGTTGRGRCTASTTTSCRRSPPS